MSEKNNGINRREFLRLAGVAAAGTAVLASTGCSSSAADGKLPGGEISFDKETDAIVIGAGGAGLWAAYELVEAGYKPIVVEKAASWGGDTILACGVLPVHGTAVQTQQGITDVSAEDNWEATKDRYQTKRVPELSRVVMVNAARAIDIWTEKFGVEWMEMDKESYTKFFHIPAPGMQNDHKLLEPLYDYDAENGAEFMFETRAVSLIVNDKNEPMGVRVKDEVTQQVMDISAKKICFACGDFVSNQEFIAKFLPEWSDTRPSTYGSMGEGIDMALAVGANTVNMKETAGANLMSHFAPTVVWGFYDSLIHVGLDGKRMCNENRIFDAPDVAHQTKSRIWWSIFDERIPNGVHKTSYASREKQGGVVVADTIEELAAQTMLPYESLKATIEKYNSDAEAGEDTEFAKMVSFTPLTAPYYAVKNDVVRYKTAGGLSINEKAEVVDKADNPIPNLYAAGSCQGETTPNVHDVCAIGMHAGQMMVEALKA